MTAVTDFSIEVTESNQAALLALLGKAKAFSVAPVSQFYVGAVVIGQNGQAYLGANMEFENQPIQQTVHAEQAAITLARSHGEQAISHLIVSEWPCGHCRQFLLELGQDDLPITLVQPDQFIQTSLNALLPHPFTLAENDTGLLQTQPVEMAFDMQNPPEMVVQLALEAARYAYVPYTHSYAGVAIELNDETFFSGNTLESAAFNPTLPPLQAALIHMHAAGHAISEIKQVVLVEHEDVSVSYAQSAYSLSKNLAPVAKFMFFTAK